jgi:asparagine synthase (glutamine-hydrolysing)
MSRFQVYQGANSEQFEQHLRVGWGEARTPTLTVNSLGFASSPQPTTNHVVFAFMPDNRCDVGEHSTLFSSPDGRCTGIFSGKLFDVDRLLSGFANELSTSQKLGTLLQQLHAQHGLDFPLQLHGFFAIVMVIDGQLLAVRDAIGERPVYILQTPTSTLISDRLATLMSNPDCERVINPAGVSDFLSTGFSPFERTPVKGISKLQAGVIATITQSGIATHHYHQLRDSRADNVQPTETQSIAEVRAALESAVANRLESNTKTGLLLSGGLDSSLVGVVVGGQQLTAAYSLNFGQEYRNELEFSGLMAQHLGVPSRVITVTSEMIKAKFLQTATILDEPIGDPLTVPNIIVVEEAAKEVQLVFNGEGGDPVFGGPKNLPIMAFEAYNMGAQDFSREEMYLRAYNKGHEHLPVMLSKEFQQQLTQYQRSAELLAPLLNDARFDSYLHRLMHINLRLKGGSQILPKVLKASAAAGIAVRSPLFDRELTELAFSLPPVMKLKGTVEKYVLKQAVSDIVPAVIIDRPKSGMLVPVHYWFNKELKAFAKEVLLNRNAKIRNLIERKALQNLIDFKGGGIRPYYGDRLWLLLSLELWMQAHNISDGL